jgi:hypothetical protein
VQYTCTGADADAIANLIDIGRGQPLPKEGSPRYRFFILDEVSNMSNQQLSKFLEVLETTNPYNVWILVSMKPEKLDATLANALLSRCSTYTFPPLTTEELNSTLIEGGVDEAIAAAISPYCNGNARLAWRKFDSLLMLNPDATPGWIEKNLTGGATKESRTLMWDLLYRGEVKRVIELVQSWSCDNDSLIGLIKEDLIEAMCTNLNPTQGRLLHALTTTGNGEVMYTLLAWVGQDVLGKVRTCIESTPSLIASTLATTPFINALLTTPADTLNHVSQWAMLRNKYELRKR